MNTRQYCSSPGPVQIRRQKGSVPPAVHEEFMPFFISQPTGESLLAQGIKNTGEPQREDNTAAFAPLQRAHLKPGCRRRRADAGG